MGDDIYYQPMMPYTWGLLQSIPRLGHVSERLEPISGAPPVLDLPAEGLSRSTRAARTCSTPCHVEEPQLLPVDGSPRGRVPPLPRRPGADRPGTGRRHMSVTEATPTPRPRSGPASRSFAWRASRSISRSRAASSARSTPAMDQNGRRKRPVAFGNGRVQLEARPAGSGVFHIVKLLRRGCVGDWHRENRQQGTAQWRAVICRYGCGLREVRFSPRDRIVPRAGTVTKN